MPQTEARNCRRTVARSRVPVCTSEPSFMASTGRTQGITLRISPPARAISNTHHKAGACAGRPSLTIDALSCARPLSARTSDRRLPLRSGAASPQLSVTGICATSVSPVSEKVGLPKSTFSTLSINSDGCCQPASRTAVTVSFPPP